MTFAPTPVTAALSGVFSGLTWPVLWPWFHGTDALDSMWLIVATLVLVALPAHAFVVGFRRTHTANATSVDSALLVRVGTWLASAAATAVVVSLLRG